MELTFQYNSFKDLDKILSETIDKVENMRKYSDSYLTIKKIKDVWNLKINIEKPHKINFK